MSLSDELFKSLYGSNPTPPQKVNPWGFPPPSKAQPSPSFFPVVKPQPKPFVRFAKPKVFVSFDYENDGHYKLLLEAWNANTKFQFTFQDKTPQEIQSESVARVKAVLTTKVQQASHVLIIVGKYANQRHRDAQEIGCLNWIHFECQQAMLYKKKLVAVILETGNQVPSNVNGTPGIEVYGFKQADIISALNRA